MAKYLINVYVTAEASAKMLFDSFRNIKNVVLMPKGKLM